MTTTATPTTASQAADKPAQMIDVASLPADQAVPRLIDHAVNMGCSDLFFVANDQHTGVLVRHLGIIRPISVLPSELAKRCNSHMKASSGMDMTQTRRPMDGRWIYRRPDASAVDLRISVIPTMYGEDFAIRLLARGNRLFQLENIGMGKDQYGAYLSMLTSPSGLILITGPTGSGKTATLYASLIRLNDGRRKINTIEDPIEYAIEGLRQSQVNTMMNPPLAFGELLRSVLRQSPDIVMIGEIRDEETARTAVHAANSGMLVFATLHSPARLARSSRCAVWACRRISSARVCEAWSRSVWFARSVRIARSALTWPTPRTRSMTFAPGSARMKARCSTPPRAAPSAT